MAGSRTRTGRAARRVATLAALGAAVVLAGCVPPPAPGPEVRPQPDDRGQVPGLDVAPSAGCDDPGGLSSGASSLLVETAEGHRRAVVRVPESATGSEPAPVLLSLHPFTSTGAAWESLSGLADAAFARGYVTITPEGSQPGPRWAVPGGLDTGVDDIGFLDDLLDRVEDGACVDRNREFAAGFSAGAAMSQALSCALPWRMAAVAGSGGTNLTDLCPDSPPTDVLVMHGSVDPIAPVTGSEVVFAPPLGLAVDDVVATNAARAGCAADPDVLDPFPSVRIDRYPGCDDHRVEYWRLIGAGHTWAGTSNPLLELVTGPTNTDISATEVVLDFFDAV